MAGSKVENITTSSFQKDVVERSMETPVLLDFWAAWCEPCRTLGPALEKLADDYGGGFVLGKVDIEAEQELAQAFGVQGIPFCVLVRDGRPADGFQGVLPEAELEAFLERNDITKVAGEPPASEPEVEEDPNSPEARLERARKAVAMGDVAAVEDALSGIPEEEESFAEGQRLAGGLTWFSPRLDASDGDAAEKLISARQQFLGGNYDGAMTEILESVGFDRDYQQGLARRAMLLCFVVVGEQDERLDAVRRRLATLLY
jgi:putative thioredoxin